jgi:serine/threonine protein kinase
MSLNNKNVPEGILSIVDKEHPPKLNKVKKRCLILSPTVNAGLEPESKITDFEKEKEIGKGGFGLVWKVIHKKTQKVYCIKVIQKSGIIEQKLVDQMNREIEIMYILNHPHCLRLKNHFEDDNNFYLVMPLAAKGQLYRVLRKFRKFDERTAAQILRETISALQYLHNFNPPIIHRDIKPENLLLNEGGRILLADFGWSNFSDGGVRKTFCGTPEYIAPEMLLKKGHDTRVDIWSVGVLMFELLSGYSPFVAKNNQDLYQNIRRLKIQWPKDMQPLAKNLIGKILKLNPLDRPSLQEVLDHQWFKQTKIIKPLLENKLNSTKDLLVYHMLSEPDEEVLTRINNLLNLKGQDADNTKAKNIAKEVPDSDNVKQKNNIMKQIEAENKNKNKVININEVDNNPNNNIKEGKKNENQISSNSNTTSSGKKNVETQKGDTPSSSVNSNISTINVSKEQKDLLLLENAGLKKDNELYKTKLLFIEKELRNLKLENNKLKNENATSLQELIKKKDEEIEKLNSMNKDRNATLNELEEKNKLNMELNNKIQIIRNEKLQKEKTIETITNKIKDLNKQLETKDVNINEMNKKNEALDQEKEQLFLTYQKKIEELQSKVLDNTNKNSSSEEDTSGGLDLSDHTDTLNSNIDAFKNIFNRKINNYKENFEQFKNEYKVKDETFNNLLNTKTQSITEIINKCSENLSDNIQKIFNEVNKPVSNVKEQKIEWLKKQIDELSEYKKKGIEYENKIRELTNDNQIMEKKIQINEENLNILKKNLLLKDEAITSIKANTTLLEQKCNDMRAFIIKNCTPEQREKFKQAGLY